MPVNSTMRIFFIFDHTFSDYNIDLVCSLDRAGFVTYETPDFWALSRLYIAELKTKSIRIRNFIPPRISHEIYIKLCSSFVHKLFFNLK